MSAQLDLSHYTAEGLADVLRIGAHVKKGGKITQAMVGQMAAAYPYVPVEYIAQRAGEINALPASERTMAFVVNVSSGQPHDYKPAMELLENFAGHYEREQTADVQRDVAADVGSRLEARAAEADRARGVTQKSEPVEYKKSDTRMEIEKAMGLDRREVDPYAVADRLERASNVLDNGDKVSLHETLSAAFDGHAISDAIDEGLVPGIEP